MFVLLLWQIGWYTDTPELAAYLHRPLPLAMTGILVVLMLAAMAVRSERASRWVLIALVARYLVSYLL